MKSLSTKTLIALYFEQVKLLFDYKTGVKSIGDFVSQLELLAKEMYPSCPEDVEDGENPSFKFKGDMLEILSEIFFNIYSSDTAVGLLNYCSVPINEDYGVDAIGINVNGDAVAVQVKYKANPLTKISYEEIAKTYTAAKEIHHLSLDKDNTIFVFTTGNERTMALQKVLLNKVRIIDRKIISGYIDNNQNFWDQAQELILDTFDELSKNSEDQVVI